MIKDQASELRQLKQQMAGYSETPEEFLSSVPHPCSLKAVTLIIPDEYASEFPSAEKWLTQIMKEKSCFWDQAEIASHLVMSERAGSMHYRMPETVEYGGQMLTIRPAQKDYTEIIKSSAQERISFLRQLVHTLKQYDEVWISIKASQLKEYNSLIQNCNSVCVMIPGKKEGILPCYEAVKNIKSTGYSSSFACIEFTEYNQETKLTSAERLKNAAKKFLNLELINLGTVLPSCTFKPDKIIDNPNKSESVYDFLYSLSESIVYLIPGMI